MNRRILISAALFVVLGGSAFAQTTEMLAPSEPALKRAPANSEWTIQLYENREKTQEAIGKNGLENPQGDGPAEPRSLPKSVTVSKDGTTYREVVQWDDGRSSEKWISDNMQVYTQRFSGQLARAASPYSDDYSDYRRSDFEGLEWVNRSNFQGIKDMKGRKVFEFRVDADKRPLNAREASILADPNEVKPVASGSEQYTDASAKASPGYTAYLDVQTQLPVYFDDGVTIRIYKFSERGPGKLVIPPQFAAELDAWKKSAVVRKKLPPP